MRKLASHRLNFRLVDAGVGYRNRLGWSGLSGLRDTCFNCFSYTKFALDINREFVHNPNVIIGTIRRAWRVELQ